MSKVVGNSKGIDGSAQLSWLDLFSGKHTTNFIVAILFIVTFLGFILVVCVKETMPDNLVSGMFGLLGVLAGFFAGSNLKNN